MDKQDLVNHPPHYTWLNGCEVIDITGRHPFVEGNVAKYLLRALRKGTPLYDLRKAHWYANYLIGVRKGEVVPKEPDLEVVGNELAKCDRALGDAFTMWSLAVKTDELHHWENVSEYIQTAIALRI